MVAVQDRKVARPNKADVMLAKTAGRTVTDMVDLEVSSDDSDAGIRSGQTTHTRPINVWAWKPTQYGWRARAIKATSLPQMLREGWLPYCGDCDSDTCGSVTDANKCPGRTPLAFRRCPECGKKVFDAPNARAELSATDEADENEIVDDQYETANAESRTKARLDLHIATFHPAESSNYNVAVKMGAHPSVGPQPVPAA